MNLGNNKIGVVILNYFAQQLLDIISQLNRTNRSDAMLLNAEGYWLSHSQAEKTWGFMFDREETMNSHFSLEWDQINHSDSGQIESKQGIFTFDTIYPLEPMVLSSHSSGSTTMTTPPSSSSKRYYWKAVTHIRPELLSQERESVRLMALLVGTILSTVLLLASWWRAYTYLNHHSAQQALAEGQQRNSAILESAIDAIITTDDEGNVVECNPSAQRMFEFSSKEVWGKNIAELIIPQELQEKHTRALHLANQKQHYTSSNGRFETVAKTLGGRRFPIEITVIRMVRNHLKFYTAFLRDISDRKAYEESIYSAKRLLERRVRERTEKLVTINQDLQKQIIERTRTEERLKLAQEALKQSNQKLSEHANKDSLTGIANRRAFDDHLHREWLRCQRNRQSIALILFDIDFFKHYNDNYGHLAGDECLRTIGEMLQSGRYTKRPGDFIARYGGEEFVAILSGSNAAGASDIAESIRADIASLKILHEKRGDDSTPIITVSLGVALMQPESGTHSESLVAAADQALYAAKSRGRDAAVFFSNAL
jgi:diguanylate cyclase (GGDEF)-like protein/PAS domain S-box-containing protein